MFQLQEPRGGDALIVGFQEENQEVVSQERGQPEQVAPGGRLLRGREPASLAGLGKSGQENEPGIDDHLEGTRRALGTVVILKWPFPVFEDGVFMRQRKP